MVSMPTWNPQTSGLLWQYVNPTIQSGDTITSTLLANPKTPFPSASTSIPEAATGIGYALKIVADGVYSTVLTLPFTLTVELGGLTVGTAVLPVSLLSGAVTNRKWQLDLEATIQASGLVEVQGQAMFWTTATAMAPVEIKNTTQFSMSTVGGVPINLTAQWGALSLGGSIQLRQIIAQVFANPT